MNVHQNLFRLILIAVASVTILTIAILIAIITITKPNAHFIKIDETAPIAKAKEVPIQSKSTEPQMHSSENSNNSVDITGSVYNDDAQPYRNSSLIIKHATSTDKKENQIEIDPYGRYRIQLESGNYICMATAPDAIAAVTKTVNTARDASYPVNFYLPRTRELQIGVVDETGKPISQVKVDLHALHTQETAKVAASDPSISSLQYSSISVATGEMSFPSIWPGNYKLIASATGYLNTVLSPIYTDRGKQTVILKKPRVYHC
jgi:hypothetical protein